MSRRRVLLFRVSRPWSRSVLTPPTVEYLFSSDPVAFTISDDVGTRSALARISGADDIVVSRGATSWPLGGRSSQRAGTIALLNGDRALDWMLGEEVLGFGTVGPDWRDGRYQLRWCWDDEAADPSYLWDDCRLWQAGVIDRVSTTPNNRSIVFALADPLAWIDVPWQRALYPDACANPAVRGKPRPRTLGSVRYAPGVLRSTAITGDEAFAYDYHDGEIEAVTTAFDRGDAFVAGTDWRYTVDRQGIKLANQPDRPVCAHVDGGGLIDAGAQILLGGSFTTLGGTARNDIARIAKAGPLDTGFNPNANGSVTAILAMPGRVAILGGTFTTVGGTARNRIARLNADGSLDTTFNPDAGNSVLALAAQADGKVILGGLFTTVSATARNRIARLNADGSLDTSYNPDANNIVRALAVQADGKCIVGGNFFSIAGVARSYIARINADGTLDTAYNPSANTTVYALAIQSDGKHLVGGNFTTIAGGSRNRIARLNTDGTLDTSFDPNVNNTINVIALQADGKILIGGAFTTVGGAARNYLARLNSDGTLDTTYNPAPGSTVSALVVDGDGRLLVGGSFTSIAGGSRNRIARLNADGTLDTTFNPDANNTVSAIALVDVLTPADRLPQFVEAVVSVVDATAYADGRVDTAAIAALDTASPYTLGCYTDSPISALSLLQQAMHGWCGWVASKRDGSLTVGRLRARGSDVGTVRLTMANIVRITRRDDTAPGLTLRLAGQRNYTVHSDSDIAASVTGDARAELQAEYTIKVADVDLPSAYNHADAAEAQATLLQSATDLQTEIDRVGALFGQQASWYDVDAALGSELAEQLEIGDWVHVTADSYGLDAGKWLLLMATTIRFRSRAVALTLLEIPGST
ncbi:MAG: delta-60 repeat domain-containing protein [Xanthomonadales bacterium]|nr:delta-60 repeat domain-containing protein [Xanthomonadales bacterium]